MTPSSTPPPPPQPRLQYFKPYVSADLQKMAEAFNTSVEQLEVELKKLILDGQIAARIDSHAQVCPLCVSILSKVQLCLWLCACLSVHVPVLCCLMFGDAVGALLLHACPHFRPIFACRNCSVSLNPFSVSCPPHPFSVSPLHILLHPHAPITPSP